MAHTRANPPAPAPTASAGPVSIPSDTYQSLAPSKQPAAAALLAAGDPLSVSIPRLESTAVVSGAVVVQSSGPEQGLLTAPSNYHELGWYLHASSGILVIDGHVGYRDNPGPLAYIGDLVVGDKVVVTFREGPRSYGVSFIGRAPKGALPGAYFSAPYTGQVMLITCDYTSNFRQGHYADNIFVIAAPR